MPLLEARALFKHFGGVMALKNIHLTLEKGEIVGLIGPNGAGKTSLFNCLTGLLTIDKGEILFQDGRIRLNRLSPDKISEQGVARTFQNLRIFKNMTVLENVAIGFHRRACTEKQIFDGSQEWLDFMGLGSKKNEIACNLSYGSQKRLEIARALACDPKLLLLDEPVAGMNPNEKKEISELIQKIRKRNVSVFIIEHDMKVVMPLCDRVLVMDEGEMIAQGSPEFIQNNARVIQAYLGEG